MLTQGARARSCALVGLPSRRIRAGLPTITRRVWPIGTATREESCRRASRTAASMPSSSRSTTRSRRSRSTCTAGLPDQKLRHDRRHDHPPKHHWCRDAQPALRLSAARFETGFGFLDRAQDRPAALVEFATLVGQRHPARRAVEKPNAKVRLQCRQQSDDRRLRNVERCGRSGQAAAFDDTDKRLHALELVHAPLSPPKDSKHNLAARIAAILG